MKKMNQLNRMAFVLATMSMLTILQIVGAAVFTEAKNPFASIASKGVSTNNEVNFSLNSRHHTPKGFANRKGLESQFKSFRETFFHPHSGEYNENHIRADPSRISPLAIFSDWRNTTGYVNVLDFGADPSGQFGNTRAFEAALKAGAGGKVFVPAGTYVFNQNGTGILIPPFTVLAGVNSQAFSAWHGGTTLVIRGKPTNPSSNIGFIRLQGPDTSIQGMSIFYADQNPPTAASPIAFPPLIQGNGDNMFVQDMLLVNPYIGIDFATHPCGRHFIHRVYGQPLQVAVQIDQVYDIGRVKEQHYWPFFASYIPQNKMDTYIMQNAITFLIKRTDWQIIEDVFSWGYHRGISFVPSTVATGAISCNGQFSNINFDDVNVGLEITISQPPGLFFDNLNIANAGNGPNQIAVVCPPNATGNTHAVIRGLSVWGQFEKAVSWNCSGKLGLSDFIITNWPRGGTAIDVTGGRVNIRAGYFQDSTGTAISIGSGVDRAIVSENDLIGNALKCENKDHMCSNNLP